ncbi:MAG: ribosome biogenesis GTPase Der [bacterium]|nr:ribosome biogenesis GTPase Der [bacterium]
MKNNHHKLKSTGNDDFIQSQSTSNGVNPKTIVIVGRMNVGKSTLFNRIIGGANALVSPIAGTTRDWQEAKTQWRDTSLRIIDTGGVEQLPKRKSGGAGSGSAGEDEGMQAAVERATKKAIAKADIMLFLVDGKEGMLPQDRSLAKLILRKQKPIILAVNKVDSPYHRSNAALFWKLGCGEPHPIAALTGAGVGDLLDIIIETLKQKNIKTPDRNLQLTTDNVQLSPLRIAVIGKPNVGKSSLVNAILGEERVIVSPIAGTTREPIDTDFERDGKRYTLVDTAGIRRHAERTRTLEGVGVERTIKALYRTDVALLVFESQEALASQDLRIAATLVDNTVGVVIIANKWDLFHEQSSMAKSEEQSDVTKRYAAYIRRQIPHIAWATILFVSATTNRNVQKILAVIEAAAREREKMIPEATLAAWLKRLTYRPHKNKSERKVRMPHIYGMKQVSIAPPTFELVTEFKVVPTKSGMQKETVRDSYIRFLENQLRASFGFTGTPIVVKVKTIE